LLYGGPFGLLLGDVIGKIAAIAVLSQAPRYERRKISRSVNVRHLTKVALFYRRFPLFLSVAVMINAASLYMPPIFMALLYGSEVVGFFSLALRFIAVPIIFVGHAVNQVFSAEASIMREDHDGLKRLFYTNFKALSVVAMLTLVPVNLFAQPAFSFILGEQWREAGYYVQLMSISFPVAFVASALDSPLTVLERQGWVLAWASGRLVLVILLFATIYYWHLPSHFAILGYSMVHLLSYSFQLALVFIAIRSCNSNFGQSRNDVANQVSTP
jgi:O-antigen/teichoic acid export membrane protein